MSKQWFLLIVFIAPDIIAKKPVQLYGVDIDSIIDDYEKSNDALKREYHEPDNELDETQYLRLKNMKLPLFYNSNKKRYNLLHDELAKLEKMYVLHKQKKANQNALAELLGYYANNEHPRNKPRLNLNHHKSERDIEKLLNLVVSANDFTENDYNEHEVRSNRPNIIFVNMERLKDTLEMEKVPNTVDLKPFSYLSRGKKKNYNGPKSLLLPGRRASRDSKEGNLDSMESDYKPAKRPRDHLTGRTAIPYIKNRGVDIYDRDEKK